MTSTDPQSRRNDHLKLKTLFNVKGKSALVSDEPTEVGLLAARALAANGARVYIVGRRRDELKRLIETLGTDVAGSIFPIPADLTLKSSFMDIYDQFAMKEPHLDILINDAGISTVMTEPKPKTEEETRETTSEKEEESPSVNWEAVYRQKTSRCFFLTTAFRSLMSTAPDGSIINISSISAPVDAEEHQAQCRASHAASVGLTQGLAKYVAEKGDKIRVNGIVPGVCQLELTASKSDNDSSTESHVDQSSRQSNDREMAAAVLFVASNQYLNRQVITVDSKYVGVAGD